MRQEQKRIGNRCHPFGAAREVERQQAGDVTPPNWWSRRQMSRQRRDLGRGEEKNHQEGREFLVVNWEEGVD